MSEMYFLDHIWLIPLFPAVGRGLHVLLRTQAAKVGGQRHLRRRGRAGVRVDVRGGLAVHRILGRIPGKPFEKVMFTWLGTGDGSLSYVTNGGHTAQFKADAGFLLDPLSCIWLLFVTGVGHAHPHLLERATWRTRAAITASSAT